MGIECDGVWLETRRPTGKYDRLIRVARAITQLYQAPAGKTVKSIYVDDRNSEFYEVDLVDDLPTDLVPKLADDIRGVFRELGYNGLIVRYRQIEQLNDGSWWNEVGARSAKVEEF
jgi:hypothetical protein